LSEFSDHENMTIANKVMITNPSIMSVLWKFSANSSLTAMAKWSNRTRLSLLLTQVEFRQLCDALGEIYPMGKSFLMLEAIQAGIMNPNKTIPETKRTYRVRFWLPKELAFHPYIEPRREYTKLVVENERRESFTTIARIFFFLLQLTELAEV